MSSDLKNFVINFYVTYDNNEVNVKFTTLATAPSSNNIMTNITTLMSYLQKNDINLGNYSMISEEVTKISSQLSSISTSKYSSDVNILSSLSSSKDALINQLQIILSKLQTNNDSVSEEVTTPDEDTDNSPRPTINGHVRSTRKTSINKVTKQQTIGQLVSSLQANSTKASTNFNTFVGKVKSAVGSIDKTKTVSTSTSTQLTGRSNNIINRIATTLLNGSGLSNRKGRTTAVSNTSTTATQSSMNELIQYQPPPPSTGASVTNTEEIPSGYYEITTMITGDYLSVEYLLFQANSTTSSQSFTFTLTPKSLIQLSYHAFRIIKNMSSSQKLAVLQQYGLNNSNPSDSDVWNSYLVWLFSYLGTGVGSQLFITPIVPFPISPIKTSANYMLNHAYLNVIGNFGLTMQSSTLNSEQQAMLTVSIPGLLPELMYSFNRSRYQNTHSKYMANVIIEVIKSETSTTNT